MSTVNIHQVSSDAVKEAVISLIKENNAEFKQLLADLLPKPKTTTAKPKQNGAVTTLKKEPIPYSEMPFWKAHPDLKPLVAKGNGITKEALKELQALFQDPECPPIDWWLEQLD